MFVKFSELPKNCTLYIIMKEGSLYLATDDEEFAGKTLERLELSNEHFIEEEYDMKKEDDPAAFYYMMGREGDHVYMEEIVDGLEHFEDEEEYETEEGDYVTLSEIESCFSSPGCFDDDFEDDDDEM